MVAVSHLDERTEVEDIWWFDLRRQTSERLTTERVAARYPAWLPDSAGVAFLASREPGSWGLFSRTTAGRGDERSLLSGQRSLLRIRDATSDGRFLLFTRNQDLWLLPLTGGRDAYPLMPTPFAETHARVSPDGRWLAFASSETGELQVYVTSFPTPTDRIRVSTAGGTDPQWRGDGRELYYVSADHTLMAVPVRSGPIFQHGTPAPLFRMSFEPFSLTFGSAYTPARDGQRLLVVEMLEPDEPRLIVSMQWSLD